MKQIGKILLVLVWGVIVYAVASAMMPGKKAKKYRGGLRRHIDRGANANIGNFICWQALIAIKESSATGWWWRLCSASCLPGMSKNAPLAKCPSG